MVTSHFLQKRISSVESGHNIVWLSVILRRSAQLVDIMQNFQIQGRQRKAAESNEKQKHDIVEMYKYPSCQAAGEARAGLGWAGLGWWLASKTIRLMISHGPRRRQLGW